MKIPKPIELTLQERERERDAEGKNQRSETVAAKIDRLLDGGMNADEADQLTREYGLLIDKEVSRRDKEKVRQADAKRRGVEEYATNIWRGKQSAESFFAEQKQFMADFPQVVRSWENIDLIAHRPISENLVPSYNNLVVVLHQLAASGEIMMSPAAVGLGEDQITGEALRNYPHRKQLLRPSEELERQRVANQSADEFLAAHDELRDKRIPHLILQGVGKMFDTFSASHPEFSHTDSNVQAIMAALPRGVPLSLQLIESTFQDLAERGQLETNDAIASSGATRVVDFGPRQRGVPPRPEKPSFREKIRSMTADQIAERCANDPDFKQALDNL